jgi:crotonobetainyl-CoA:carnitine CoA-transferase CaiB-like acyl-CoA transferase
VAAAAARALRPHTCRTGQRAPTLGRDTDAILSEAGLGERIEELRAAGVVA